MGASTSTLVSIFIGASSEEWQDSHSSDSSFIVDNEESGEGDLLCSLGGGAALLDEEDEFLEDDLDDVRGLYVYGGGGPDLNAAAGGGTGEGSGVGVGILSGLSLSLLIT